MSRMAGIHLPASLVGRLAARNSLGRAAEAIVICTVDDDARPHPAMLSSLEVVASDDRHLRMAIHGMSRTTRNLRARHAITLVLADPLGVFYIKGDAVEVSASMASAQELSKFEVLVVAVFEDDAAAHEHARLVSGIVVERGALDAERALAIVEELSTDP